MTLGVLCTGAVPKIAILFLTRGSREGLGGAGGVGDGGGVVGVQVALALGGESGDVVVCVAVIGVSLCVVGVIVV